MCQLYPEQLPDVVKDKARQVAEYFQSERFATKKELTKMSQLSAECAKVFPPDFASVDPEEVVRAVSNEMNEHLTRLIIVHYDSPFFDYYYRLPRQYSRNNLFDP